MTNVTDHTIVAGSSFTEYTKTVSANNSAYGTVAACGNSGNSVTFKMCHGMATGVLLPSAGYCYTDANGKMLNASCTATAKNSSTFLGWYVDGASKGTGAYVADIGDETIVAVFGLPFTVKFDANGGTGDAPSDKTYYYGCSAYAAQGKIEKCALTRSGHSFAGWNTKADGSGVSISDENDAESVYTACSLSAGGTVTLYAQWTYNLFNITVTKADTDATATLPSGVGTLTLKDSEGNTLATESGDVLFYEGSAGVAYTVSCAMSETGVSALYSARGVYGTSAYANPYVFTPSVGSVLAKVFKFTAKPLYEVTVTSSVAGCSAAITSPTSPDTGGKYAEGRVIVITGTPAAGYELTAANASGDTYDNIVGNTFSLSALDGDKAVTCIFTKIDYTLTAQRDAASASAISAVQVGSTAGVTRETAQYGDTVTFTATVAAGYSFDGWYDGDTKVSSAATYAHTVTGTVTLVAKASVTVALAVVHDNNDTEIETPTETCSVTPTSATVVLGQSVAYALTLGSVEEGSTDKWIFDAWYETATPQTYTAPKDYAANGTLTPTANVSLTARVTSKVIPRNFTVHIENEDDATHAHIDNSTAIASSPAADAGAWDATDRQYEWQYNGTKSVTLTAAETVTVGATTLYFSDFAVTSGGVTETHTGNPLAVVSNGDKTIVAHYGASGSKRVTLAYGKVGGASCDATMGTIEITGTNDAAAVISSDLRSATVTRGKTLTFAAMPKNGYLFSGWYAAKNAGGDPVYGDTEVTITVGSNATLYAAFVQDTNAVYEWEGEANLNKTLEWRSKTYEGARPFNPSCARIDALGYPLTEFRVDLFSAPDAEATATVTLVNVSTQGARRLPVRRRERYMQVAVKASAEIDAILIGTNMAEIAK